jgi:hypothetical protein
MSIVSTLSQTKAWRISFTAAVVGIAAVAATFLTPAESASAEVRRIRIGNTPVTVTQVNTHNWGSLSPNNIDTVVLKDGSRGSYWSFDVRPGQCVQMAMESDEFRPYLSLRTGGPDGSRLATQEGNAHYFAKITLMNANGGTYYLLASSAGGGDQRGRYTLDITPC